MANKQRRNKTVIMETKQGIDLAAMVDITFLLLAYFLINSTLAKTPSIKIDLPKSETSSYVSEEAINIHVKENGKIFINAQETEAKELTGTLKKVLAKRKGKTPEVNIKGDKKTQYQHVISTIDRVRKAGLEKFNLTTQR
ncbi:MAG: biopolymer transporter ExbD [Spirochaetota bacterium]